MDITKLFTSKKENMETKVMSAPTKGLIIGAGLGLLSIAMQILVTDISKMQSLGYATWAIMIGALIWACIKYGQDMEGRVTFGNVFAHGFQVTAVVTLILLAVSVLSVFVLFPDTKDKVLDAAREQMEKDGKLSETQIDQAIQMTSKFFTAFMIAGSVIGNLIQGVIGSLIGAAVAKKGAPAQHSN
jgi:hypothetical protein